MSIEKEMLVVRNLIIKNNISPNQDRIKEIIDLISVIEEGEKKVLSQFINNIKCK